jgi:hypothetical protein
MGIERKRVDNVSQQQQTYHNKSGMKKHFQQRRLVQGTKMGVGYSDKDGVRGAPEIEHEPTTRIDRQ